MIAMKHCIIILLSFILLSDCAISQEQSDSTITNKKGYHFGLTLGYNYASVKKLHNPSPLTYGSDFLGGLGYFGLTSLHNLHKNWDIGFNVGIYDIGKGQRTTYWSSFLIAAYGYYYPIKERVFIRFGLENNKHFDLYNEDGHGTSSPTPQYLEFEGVLYNNKFNFRTSLSLGVGLNVKNNLLLNIAISVPFYNKYPRRNIYYPPDVKRNRYYPDAKLYYVITGGVTWLFL